MSHTGRHSKLLHSVALAALAASAIALPFEPGDPWLRLGPVGITQVEALLYVLLLLWAVGRLRGRWRIWTRGHTLVVVWAALVSLTALPAAWGGDAGAIAFASRQLAGCLLFLAAADIAFTARYAAIVTGSFSVGACLSAALAVGAVRWPGASPHLLALAESSRAASAHWAAALPVVLALGAWLALRRERSRWMWGAVAASLPLLHAVVLTGSRTGVLVTALTLVSMRIAGRGPFALLVFPSIACLAALAALLVITPAGGARLLSGTPPPDPSQGAWSGPGAAGWIVLALIAVSLGRRLLLAWRVRAEPENVVVALGAVICVAALLMQGVVEGYHAFTPASLLFWLAAGVAASLMRMRHAG